MSDYRYTLIISQYWHSYHYFIVKFNENTFVKQMQELTKELDKHKGGGVNDNHAITQSDPFYEYQDKEIHRRYNVNGNGDIYFLNSISANKCQEIIQNSISETKFSRQGFKKKAITDDINKNHSYGDIAKIIKKHFEIA